MINIVRRRYLYFTLSLLIIIPGLVSLAINGLRLSISFTSGALLEVRFTELNGKSLAIDDVRSAYESRGLVGPLVQIANNDTVVVRSKPLQQDVKTAIENDLSTKYGKFTELSFETVGPEVSAEVTRSATLAVLAASAAILIYITFAFSKSISPGATALPPSSPCFTMLRWLSALLQSSAYCLTSKSMPSF